MLSECIYTSGGGVYNVEVGEFLFSTNNMTHTFDHKPKFLLIHSTYGTGDAYDVERIVDDINHSNNNNAIVYGVMSANNYSTITAYGSNNPAITWDGNKTVTLGRINDGELGKNVSYFMLYE